MQRLTLFLFLSVTATTGVWAQNRLPQEVETDDSVSLGEVVVTSTAPTRRIGGAINGVSIGRKELFRAACCNLGESFSTNPSVDVSYSDAATGAKQIKLLGLSGTYVQMMTENIPNLRGAALPYALGYVPGAWMKSIQVSKGNASVKHGYESITGQINVDYKKPEDEQLTEINLYLNSEWRAEADVDGNINVGNNWNTILMAHAENNFEAHDQNNDGFLDKPKVRQFNLRNHWIYQGDSYAFRAGIGALTEKREGGQMEDIVEAGTTPYTIDIEADRYDAYMKHAFIIDPDKGTNIALMASGSMQELKGTFGDELYYVNEKNAYLSAIFETNIAKIHNISAGLSLNHDYFGQRWNTLTPTEKETTTGAYGQYTLNVDNKWIVMAGLRLDHSSEYSTFLTPRFHIKWAPSDVFNIRLSAGKGYRTVHALAENNHLLASGRELVIDKMKQEEAWNMGACASLNIPIGGKTLKLNAEYYYTTFSNQAVVDYDSDPSQIHITNLEGDSYSNVMQLDATYPFFKGFTITAAYRRNNVKTTYGGQLMDKPLTSRYKALITAQYKTPLELWQMDITLQLNGGGRMPTPYFLDDGSLSWDRTFGSYEQLSAQITREFRHLSVYVGGENLTNFKQKNPIINASDPWSNEFDPTMVWGPVEGIMVYCGTRIRI